MIRSSWRLAPGSGACTRSIPVLMLRMLLIGYLFDPLGARALYVPGGQGQLVGLSLVHDT